MTDIKHYRDDDPTAFTAYNYGYDRADRINFEATSHDTTIAAFPTGSGLRVQNYEFDDAGQLKNGYSFFYGDTESFIYDDPHRCREKNG